MLLIPRGGLTSGPFTHKEAIEVQTCLLQPIIQALIRQTCGASLFRTTDQQPICLHKLMPTLMVLSRDKMDNMGPQAQSTHKAKCFLIIPFNSKTQHRCIHPRQPRHVLTNINHSHRLLQAHSRSVAIQSLST